MDEQILEAFKYFEGFNLGIIKWKYLIWEETEEGIPNSVLEFNNNGRPLHDISIYDIKEVVCECHRGLFKNDKLTVIGENGAILLEGEMKPEIRISRKDDKEYWPKGYNASLAEEITKYIALYKQYGLPKGETVFNKPYVTKAF